MPLLPSISTDDATCGLTGGAGPSGCPLGAFGCGDLKAGEADSVVRFGTKPLPVALTDLSLFSRSSSTAIVILATDFRNALCDNAIMDSEIIIKWLEKGIETAGIAQADLARAVDMTPDKLNRVLKGRRDITAGELIRISMYLDRPLPLNQLAGNVRSMELRREPLNESSNVLDMQDYRPAISTEGRFGIASDEIPQIDGMIGLGSRDDIETLQITLPNGQTVAAAPVLGAWRIPQSVLQRRVRTSIDHLHMLECEGNSMYPVIKDGDVVMIDKSRTNPAMPGIFALWENGGQTIKQVEIVRGTDPVQYRLIPANKDYATYEVPAEDVIIIGRYAGRFTVD